MPQLKTLENVLKLKNRQLFMVESTFCKDWDKIGSNRAKTGHLLLESTMFSKLAGFQWVYFLMLFAQEESNY